jgi:hypothetical protein
MEKRKTIYKNVSGKKLNKMWKDYNLATIDKEGFVISEIDWRWISNEKGIELIVVKTKMKNRETNPTLKEIIELKKEAESKVDEIRKEFHKSTGLHIDEFTSNPLGYSVAKIEL